MKKSLIAFDVDGTLIENGAMDAYQAKPNHRIVSMLIGMAHMKNTKIMVWSGGGEEWARDVVKALGLEKYVNQYADKQYTSCEDMGCTQPKGSDGTCTQHHFKTDIKPDIAIDDIQACELGIINLIVREK